MGFAETDSPGRLDGLREYAIVELGRRRRRLDTPRASQTDKLVYRGLADLEYMEIQNGGLHPLLRGKSIGPEFDCETFHCLIVMCKESGPECRVFVGMGQASASKP